MPKHFRVSDIRWSDLTPGQREAGAAPRQMISVEAECRTCNYPFTASVTNRWLTAAGSSAVVMCPQCNSTETIEGRP